MIFMGSVKMNLANKLTVLRILLIPVMVLVFYLNLPAIAAVIFLAAAITDILDGNVARKRNLVTVFGKFFDPIADKLLNISAFIKPTGLVGVAPPGPAIPVVERPQMAPVALHTPSAIACAHSLLTAPYCSMI